MAKNSIKRGGGPTPYGKNILNFHVDYLTAPLRLTCDDLDQGRQAPSTFLLDYRRPQEGLKIQHDFLAFNFHQHYQSITYVIIIDHSLATVDHNDPSKPSHLLTNGLEPSKTIESDGSNIKKPS